MRGCLFFSVVIFVFVGFFFWGAYSVYKHLYALTGDSPIPVSVYHGNAYPSARGKVDAFQVASLAGRESALKLTAEDMNALVAFDPQFSHWRGRIYFELVKGSVVTHVSVPLGAIRGMEGRWLNGIVTFQPRVENGQVVLIPQSIQSGKFEAPSEVIMSLQAFPWNSQLRQNRELAALFDQVKALRVESGLLVLENR